MSASLTIPIIVTPDYLASDFLQIEVNGLLQPDRIAVQSSTRRQQGFGFGQPQRTPFGCLVLTPPQIPFGLGLFGVGASLRDYQSRNQFDAGDYQVRLRANDGLPDGGNVGPWSDYFTIYHRPAPDPPRSPAVAGATLSWSWP